MTEQHIETATNNEDNPIISRIKQAEAEAREILEGAEREAAETLRQAKMKAQQIADEPIDVSSLSRSDRPDAVKAQIERINAENGKTIASMRESAGKKRGAAADFIVSLVMEGFEEVPVGPSKPHQNPLEGVDSHTRLGLSKPSMADKDA